MYIAIPIIVLLIVLSSFFAAAEMAFVTVDKLKVREESLKGHKAAIVLERLLKEPDEVVSAIVIGNNLANITASILAGALATSLAGNIGVGIATAVMTLLIVVFGEAIPKAYGIHNDAFAFLVARPLYAIRGVFFPLVKAFSAVSDVFLRLLGKEQRVKTLVTDEQVKQLIAVGVHEGTIQVDEQQLIEEIFDFDETKVAEVYVPLEKVVSVPETVCIEELLKLSADTGYSRFPVYRGNKEEIVGIAYVKDAFLREVQTPVHEIMRRIITIPPKMKANDVLRAMQRNKVHMAVLQSPEGKILGIVTLEDLIEEIFGEIRDEHDLK
ncbi:MAG: HlyC/CorC family transporter [Methanomicrobia archaeon]|nr:HlyC/CorC family transporter [Methanomicrobia archaeon]